MTAEDKIKTLQETYIKVGAIRCRLELDCDIKEEDEIFMAFIRVQNALAHYEDLLTSKSNINFKLSTLNF